MALKFDKIDNESVVNNVVNQITNLIINKEYVSGDKIPTETELSNSLGVSRNSIREAIKILRAMGILEVKRGTGTFVTSSIGTKYFDPVLLGLFLEPKTNKDLYEFRKFFDAMVLFCVAEKINDEQIIKLNDIINDTTTMYRDFSEYNINTFVEQDILFHKYLIEITNNPYMKRIGNFIIEFLPAYIKKSLSQKDGVKRSIENHKGIIKVLKERDVSKIIDVVSETLKEWENNWEE